MIESIEDLAPAPYNPRRKLTKKEASGLAASLKRFGDISGITFNKRTGRLVSGHKRVQMLRELGAVLVKRKSGPEIHIGKGDGAKKFRVEIVDLPEAEERAANVTANNQAIAADFDDTLGNFLIGLRESLGEDDFGELGLDDLALSRRIDLEPGKAPEDDPPDLPDNATTKTGDVWELGDHVLVCADSTKKAAAYPKNASLWLTDPPYNVAYVGKTKDALTIQNDQMDDDKFRLFLLESFVLAFGSMAPGAPFYIWHADSESYNFHGAVRDCGQTVRQCLVWRKNNSVFGRQDYHYIHEPCIYGWKKGGAHGWYSDRKQVTVLEFDRPQRSGEHPTMKPVNLFTYLIKNSSPPGAVVLDNFAGSGTTMAACEHTGRRAHLIELDPRYCDVIVERWENLTGGKAKRKTS
jgi:DNA modification methylase